MRSAWHSWMAGLFLGLACSPGAVLSPAELTADFTAALRREQPEWVVEVVGELEVRIKAPGGREATSHLDNAYALYAKDPGGQGELRATWLNSLRAELVERPAGIDRERIVPVVKDRPWLLDMRRAVMGDGSAPSPEHAVDDLNEELVIVYAEDTPTSMRYLTRAEVEATGVERSALRSLAVENLRRLLPKVETRGGDGVYMLGAGGSYEASLVLLDRMWSREQLAVEGDFVVAMPARDVLLVTGSDDPEGLDRVRRMAREVWTDNPYRLTQQLFLRRNGKLEKLAE